MEDIFKSFFTEITAWFAIVCSWLWLFLLLAFLLQTSQWSVNICAIDQSDAPFLGRRRVFLLQKSQQSVFSRLASRVLTSWFAIALDEIRTRLILREKADCKQSNVTLDMYFISEVKTTITITITFPHLPLHSFVPVSLAFKSVQWDGCGIAELMVVQDL